MIENYEIDENGVIRQIRITVRKYDTNYIDERYNSYGELTNYMGHLRFGYIVGSIGHVPESILDVGYGNGSFLKTCSKLVDKCYGNDISGYPIPVGCTFVEDITKDKYEVVTFFDSLEHFENLDFVSKLQCKYLVISLPWCHNKSDSWFLQWKHRRENEHIYHFNEKSLTKFIEKFGYSLVNYCNIEDTIRSTELTDSNILTAIFKSINYE